MFWPNVGRKYLDFFSEIALANEVQRKRRDRKVLAAISGKGGGLVPRMWVNN